MKRSLSLLFVIMAIFGLSGGLATQTVSAATRHVDSWVELTSTRPGVGCAIDISVEVRSDGAPVPGVEVELALHNDGALISADYGVTNDSGIDFLAIDTSGTSSGSGYWLDINLGGVYLTGEPIVATSGGCGESPKSIKTSGDITVVPGATAVTVSSSFTGLSGTGPGSKVFVPTYVQQRNLSCEYASLYIATSAWGNAVSEYAFDEVVGYSPNPHLGYRGSIVGAWGGTDDYGVYAQPLSWALAEFGYIGDAFYGAGDPSTLTSRLDNGWPVVVWLSLWGDQSIRDSFDGQSFTVVAGQHVMVAYGYDDDGVYLSDPGTGTYRFYPWGDFLYMWSILDGMGLAVYPA